MLMLKFCDSLNCCVLSKFNVTLCKFSIADVFNRFSKQIKIFDKNCDSDEQSNSSNNNLLNSDIPSLFNFFTHFAKFIIFARCDLFIYNGK